MKLTGLVFLLLLLNGGVYAQQRLTGILMSDVTRLPLPHATVAAGGLVTYTNGAGLFTLTAVTHADSVRINCAGYQYYAFKPPVGYKDTLIIYLNRLSRTLNEVIIKGSRNFKADSARTRKDFANIFAYEKPGVMAMFADKHYTVDVPYDHITNTRSTADIVGFNVLSVINMLSKKGSKTSRLKKQLLQDEADNFVDRAFSQQKVVNITGLKGDSLQKFMIRYRPSYKQAKKWNEFEMIGYIRKSMAGFVQAKS